MEAASSGVGKVISTTLLLLLVEEAEREDVVGGDFWLLCTSCVGKV